MMEKRLKQEQTKKNIEFVYGRNKEDERHDPDKRSFVPSRKRTTIEAIHRFEGELECLDPAYRCEVCLPDEIFDFISSSSSSCNTPYPSYEHALQATRTVDSSTRHTIREAGTVRDAKRIAGKASAPDWKEHCLKHAKSLLRDKFMRNRGLKAALMQTGSKNIEYVPVRNFVINDPSYFPLTYAN